MRRKRGKRKKGGFEAIKRGKGSRALKYCDKNKCNEGVLEFLRKRGNWGTGWLEESLLEKNRNFAKGASGRKRTGPDAKGRGAWSGDHKRKVDRRSLTRKVRGCNDAKGKNRRVVDRRKKFWGGECEGPLLTSEKAERGRGGGKCQKSGQGSR